MLFGRLRHLPAVLVLALSGCPFVSAERLEGIRDGDGDGIHGPVFGGDDCNDDAVAIGRPAEVWPDDDGDGFGDADAESSPLCPGEERPGFVDDHSDCDDADPTLNPDTPWYPDADGDGYGDWSAPGTPLCESDDLVRDATDCDDTAPAVHPGIAPRDDAPHDGTDQNCDGETELDEDGDTWADLVGVDCQEHRAVSVLDQEGLVDALADARDCDDLRLEADGPFGPVRIRASVALRAAPGTHPVFTSEAAESSALRVDPGVRALTLERIRFDGFEDTVALAEGTSLLGSALEFGDGRAILAPLQSSVQLYDSAFRGAGPVIEGATRSGPGPDEVGLERVEIALGVSPNTLLLGGLARTVLTDVTLHEVAALDALIRVPGGHLSLERVSVTGSLGPVLLAQVSGAELTDVVLRSNATVAPQLVFLHPERLFDPVRPLVAIRGLVVEDNAWTVQAPDGSTVFDLAAQDLGLIVVRNLELSMRSSRIVGNEAPPLLALLTTGDIVPNAPTVLDIESTVIAGTWSPGDPLSEPAGSVGLIVFGPPEAKRLSHLTIAHLRDLAVVTASDLELHDSVISTVGAVFVDPQEYVGQLPGLDFSQTLHGTLLHDVGDDPICVSCPPQAPPRLVRDAPELDATLQDFHPRPDSPADRAADGDLGATGGDGSDGAAYDRDEDDDGLPDGWESAWCGGDCTPTSDADLDGLTNVEELAAGTLPLVGDTDSDGRIDSDDPDPLEPGQ